MQRRGSGCHPVLFSGETCFNYVTNNPENLRSLSCGFIPREAALRAPPSRQPKAQTVKDEVQSFWLCKCCWLRACNGLRSSALAFYSLLYSKRMRCELVWDCSNTILFEAGVSVLAGCSCTHREVLRGRDALRLSVNSGGQPTSEASLRMREGLGCGFHTQP